MQGGAAYTGRMLRRLAVTLTILALLHSAAWYGATLYIERFAAGWIAAQGGQVQHGLTSRTGWPFTAAVTYQDARIASGALRWQAEALTLRWLPWDPAGFALQPSGAQRITTPAVQATYTARQAALFLPFTSGGKTRLAITELASPGITLGKLDATLRDTTLTARLAALELPGQPIPSLTSAALDGSMTAMPSGTDPLRRWTAWRDAGGRITLTDITMRTPEARASLSGSATLDAQMRPAGDGTLVLQNGPAVIDAAIAAGLLPRNLGTPARLLATVMARPAPDGGAPVITLPVQGRDGRLTVGGLAVARIPPLAAP